MKDFSNTEFVLLETTSGQNVSNFFNIWENIWDSKDPKNPEKRPFHGCCINPKIFDFTTTNAIMMKLTTDIYLSKVSHLAKSWGVSQGVGGHKQKNSQNEPKRFLAHFRPFPNT